MNERLTQFECDPFGLKKIDFSVRVAEPTEMFSSDEAKLYIDGCDYPETVDYLLPALRVQEMVGFLNGKILLDAMCGPGGLGREFLRLGANHVVFHDGDPIMINHAVNKASEILKSRQQVQSITLPVDQLRPHNGVDHVVCMNSLHQLADKDRLLATIKQFVDITKPKGSVIIFDYQRGTTPKFLAALNERLTWTKKAIVPFLRPTFRAAFSKVEFESVLSSIPGIRWSVEDATLPVLTPEMQARVNQDPVRGHLLDRSPISLEIIIQKEEI